MKISNTSLTFSKNLRTNQTPWERKLWKHLRGNRFYGLKFKRQVPIGKYIVDFTCEEKRLVVELDGGQHSESQFADSDRDKFLRLQGYTVLRIWNNDIDRNLEGVLELISRATSLPASPHAWGEGP